MKCNKIHLKLSTPLRYCHNIFEEKSIEWIAEEITTIGDLSNEVGEIYALEYLQNVLQPKCNLLFYANIKKGTTNIWKII